MTKKDVDSMTSTELVLTSEDRVKRIRRYAGRGFHNSIEDFTIRRLLDEEKDSEDWEGQR